MCDCDSLALTQFEIEHLNAVKIQKAVQTRSRQRQRQPRKLPILQQLPPRSIYYKIMFILQDIRFIMNNFGLSKQQTVKIIEAFNGNVQMVIQRLEKIYSENPSYN